MPALKNSPICFVPPRRPRCEALATYLKMCMDESTRGRDGEFGSDYMKGCLDRFLWDVHSVVKPDLYTFCRWAMAICKRGLNRKKRRPPRKVRININLDTKAEIIRKAIAYCGKIQDSFLGSAIYKELRKEYSHILHEEDFAELLISKRKITPSKDPGYVYCYCPRKSVLKDVKIGFTTKEPSERMRQATQNTCTEPPFMLGYIKASREEETRTKKHFKQYRNPNGGKEMFVFEGKGFDIFSEFFQKRITELGGAWHL